MRAVYRLLLAGFCRRWREGPILMLLHVVGGAFEHCESYRQCYSASKLLARSSIWDTSV